jgi:hypothetical protein
MPKDFLYWARLFICDAILNKVQGLLYVSIISFDLGLNWIHMWTLCSMSWTPFENFLEAKSTVWITTLCWGYVIPAMTKAS